MPIFMNYTGIPGDVTTAGHETWIAISSFQFGINRSFTSSTSSSANREGSTPTVSEIVVTKSTDGASTNLMRAACGCGPGGEGVTVNIDFCKTDVAGSEPYMQFTLSNTLLSGWTMSSGGDTPTESVSLNFTEIQFKNIGMGAANATGNPDIADYNLATQAGS